MKNVMLLTDLSVQSLWPVNGIIESNTNEEQLVIHVIHLVEMPNGIHDLMMLGRNKNQVNLPSSFNDALSVLKNKYWGTNVTVKFDFVFGNSHRILRNYMEGKEIRELFLLEKYTYHFNSSRSVNFLPLVKKIKSQVFYIPFNNRVFSEFQILSIFLNTNDAGKKEMALPLAV